MSGGGGKMEESSRELLWVVAWTLGSCRFDSKLVLCCCGAVS